MYFICPDKKNPVGGVKQIYRQVEILNKNEFQAFVVHRKKGFRVNWFNNNVPIKYYPSVFHRIDKRRKKSLFYRCKYFFKGLFINSKEPESDSILVFPETLITHISPSLFKNKKVIFNQNCYYTFNEYKKDTDYKIYLDENTLMTIVVSDDSKEFLSYKFENIKINRIHLGINELFSFDKNKKKQIAYMPRKLSTDLVQIKLLLENKKSFIDWKWVEIDKKSEKEVAKILKESAIFLSTNNIEGFGLPPAEAMLCGCYVIGYTGNGGKEYFKEEYSTIIENGDVLNFAKNVQKIVDIYNKNPSNILEKSSLASSYISDKYNVKIEEKDIIETWNNLLN